MENNPREIALNILLRINLDNAFSNITIKNHMSEDMTSQDENFVREIVYGVLENKDYLDYIISKASKVRLKKIHPTIKEILRMGIYQLYFMDGVPDSAAVNESVNLAKKHGHKGTIGFVNGVLRSISRDKEKFGEIDSRDKVKYLSIKYSHPEYLVKRWIDEFGIEFAQDLIISNNTKPKLNIRANTLLVTKDELKKILAEKGYNIEEGKYAKDCLIVDNPKKITELDAFKKGYFIIQDEASQLVAQVMNPIEGSFVLDVCSAPGGKATHLAQLMNDKGKLLARDIFNHKLQLIDENAKRFGINIIETQFFDALEKDESLVNKVDYLLIDAPCSGLGLIRRKPEIKWNRKEKDIEELSELQFNILETNKDYLRTGGILVYSTCTIENKENIDIINRFLEKNPSFKLVSIEECFDNKDNLPTLNKGYVQIYPHIHHMDGFFIAKMIKQ